MIKKFFFATFSPLFRDFRDSKGKITNEEHEKGLRKKRYRDSSEQRRIKLMP